MATLPPWEAGSDVIDLFNSVKKKHHSPRLDEASMAVCFVDSKPFIKGRFNWGKVQKFSPLAKIWHNKHYDFLIVICADAWHEILNMSQREALVDLHLERCDVEYEPEMEAEMGETVDGEPKPIKGKRAKPVKDEWGRIQYSNKIKYDDNGDPKWKIHNLDLHCFAENVRRYGVWCEDLLSFKEAVQAVEKKIIVPSEVGPEKINV